jgi:protein gp37
MAKTKIEWADKVWNPVTGCTKVTAGCQNCYAERFSTRLKHMEQSKVKYRNGFQPTVHHHELYVPYKWKKPSRIFVCSMGDLFHDDIPSLFISAVVKTIIENPRHEFLLLTKRPERMKEFFCSYLPSLIGQTSDTIYNMWLGVSIENQETANRRLPFLADIPAHRRFISAEPLLSAISLQGFDIHSLVTKGRSLSDLIHLLIIGAETGPRARISPLCNIIDLAMDGDFLQIPTMVKNIGKQNDGTKLELIKNTGI